MKITLTRSWLPWGRPNIKIDMDKSKGEIHIIGCYGKKIRSVWQGYSKKLILRSIENIRVKKRNE